MTGGFSRVVILAGLGLAACATPASPDDRLEAPPLDDNFKLVADPLAKTCGTLDCHGQIGRNLRFPGLNATDIIGGQQNALSAMYWSMVGLEPEVLTIVTREGGADPERWVVFRKARGTEKHEGGALMFPGDDLDNCLLSWVQQEVDATPCDCSTTCVAPCAQVACDIQFRRRRVQVPW